MSKYSDYQQKQLEEKLKNYCSVCSFVEDSNINYKFFILKRSSGCNKIHPYKINIDKNKLVCAEFYSEKFMPDIYYNNNIVVNRSWHGKDRGNFPAYISYYPSGNIKSACWENIKTGIKEIYFFDRPKHNIQATSYMINGIYVDKYQYRRYELIKELGGLK